jgi:4-hydroxy-tetrahydrodipicolinate synthase
MFRNQGAVMTKAALDLLGQPGGAVRAPLLAATEAERHQLTLDLTAGGVKLPGTVPQAAGLAGTVLPGSGA